MTFKYRLPAALEDYKKAFENDPSLTIAKESIKRLEPKVKEQQEREKEEALGLFLRLFMFVCCVCCVVFALFVHLFLFDDYFNFNIFFLAFQNAAKLKDLGNSFLGLFGLSTDNFKMQQDPKTGNYSINFQK